MSLIKKLRRQGATMFVIAAVIGVIFAGIFMFTSNKTPPKPKNTNLDVEIVTPSKRNIDVENLNAQLTAVQRDLVAQQSRQQQTESELSEKISLLTDQIAKANSDDEIKKRVEAAASKIKITAAAQSAPGGAGAGSALPAPAMLPAPGSVPALNAPLPGDKSAIGSTGISARGIQIAGEDDDDNGKETTTTVNSEGIAERVAKATKKDPEAWFPMGTVLSGVALNGGDFPVSNASKRDPLPMLIRLKKSAILPNNKTASVKECFAMVSGSGDASTARASLRAERLSCILEDGRAIEVPLAGYVVGEDGKPGLHGRVVTKEAEVIAKALRVGMIGALGVGVTGFIANDLTGSNGNVNVSIGGGSSASNPNASTATAASQPIGKAFQDISDYYTSLAKEIVPVIEINPLRTVDIVLVRGVGIPLK